MLRWNDNVGPGSLRRRAISPAGRPFGAFWTSKRKILRRVSCARAASESTADDVFIFPKQWKYIKCAYLCQTSMRPRLNLDFYKKCLQTAESEIGKPLSFCRNSAHMREFLENLQDGHLTLESCKLIPDAEMCARTEGEVRIVHAFQVKAVWILKLACIAIGRPEHENNLLTAACFDATELEILLCGPCIAPDFRNEAIPRRQSG